MTELEKRALEEQLARHQNRKPVWRKLLILLLLLLAVAGGVFVALRVLQQKQEDEFSLERELTAELGILPGMSEAEIQDRLNRKVAESMMNISFNPVPIFPDGKSPGNLRIENIPGNSCSFTVTIVRSDNQQVILKTGVIDPGYYVENIALDVNLPAGEYDCMALFTAYDTETLKELGQAGSTLRLTIQN